jgi:Uma2 family endonuclease
MATANITPKRWSRAEYEHMIAVGVFGPGEHVELIDGEIVAMTPQGSPHATSVGLVQDSLGAVFGPDTHIRVQLPLALGVDSEPEPDIAVVAGRRREFRQAHPTSALLVVEVSETTLKYDRQEKQRLYARAGIQDYWIVDVTGQSLEVYREPAETDGCWSYRMIQRLGARDSVAPLASPTSLVTVGDLLP